MKMKKIILSIAGTAIIVGGIIIGFSKPKPLTIDEYQALIKIYNYEIEKQGGKVILTNAKKSNIIQLLNVKLLNTSQPTSIKLNNETLTKEDYQLLKSGLFKKAEQ